MAFTDQSDGTSTPSCWKATEPSRWSTRRDVRTSQSISSYGSIPGVVKWRRIPSTPRSGATDIWFLVLLRPFPTGPTTVPEGTDNL